jgi:hypothetical protein
MNMLRMAEAHARDWMANPLMGAKDLQTLYAQWALEAQRMQAVHAEKCAECQKEDTPIPCPTRA